MLALEAGALILVLAALGLFLLLDNPPEDRGRVSRGWLNSHRDDR